MNVSFYPTDITYKIDNGKAVILLFGRTLAGAQICVLDEQFEPYFTVVGPIDSKTLLALSAESFFVTRVEKVTKNLNEQPTEAYHVFVNMPKAVPIIKDLAKKLSDVTDVFEYDILFTRRYLLDKKIVPLLQTDVVGEEIPSSFKVPCISAQSISQTKEAHLPQPRILALDIETYNPDNRINTQKNPILMIGLFGEDFSRVITWKQFPTTEKYIEFVPNESAMLARFCELVTQFGPDFLVGYYTDGFDLPYIADRAKHHKITLPLGLDQSVLEIVGRTEKEARICGIAHLDIFKFIRRVVSKSLKTDVYTLDAVSQEILGEKKHKVDMDQFFAAWDLGGKLLEQYCSYNLQDCILTYKLAQKVLPLLIEFVRVIGLTPYDINRMPFSMFVEWYIVSQATKRNEIILNKPGHSEETERMADRIKGAFVFEPKPGFYTGIVVFDYRSLYPSIIASHNISKGMLNCSCCTTGPTIATERGTFRYCTNRKGLFSTTISDLILRRADVKKQLKKNPDPLLLARSEALKVLANSFYGYMGFAPARWYCIECAESTTAWARQYIHESISVAQQAGFTVLYSDTDSVFLLLDKKTKEEALALVESINKTLPGLMELDYEGFYPAGLFVSLKVGAGGAKKKYALIDETGKIKVKGFESVRRNWSFIAKDIQRRVLEIILKEHDPAKAKEYVRLAVEEVRKNLTPIEKMVIHTALSKGLESYSSIGPHVAAAQRMEAQGISVSGGSIIKYIVVKGKGKIRDKVKLPNEVKQDDYDGEYYIQNQILPGVERIFAVLNISVDDLMSTTTQKSLNGF